VIRRGPRILLQRRPASGLFGGLWAPPLVELPAGRSSAARTRELLVDGLSRAIGVPVEVGPELASARRTLTHRELELVAYQVRPVAPPEGPGLRWATSAETERLGISTAVRALLALLPPVRPPARVRKMSRGLGKRRVIKYIAPPVAPDSPLKVDEA
jgi:adenine-specific DNA glycosylase